MSIHLYPHNEDACVQRAHFELSRNGGKGQGNMLY